MHRVSPTQSRDTSEQVRYSSKPKTRRDLNTYNELFVPEGHGEVSVERDPEVLGVITFVHHNMFQKRSLMTEDLGQSSTSNE